MPMGMLAPPYWMCEEVENFKNLHLLIPKCPFYHPDAPVGLARNQGQLGPKRFNPSIQQCCYCSIDLEPRLAPFISI